MLLLVVIENGTLKFNRQLYPTDPLNPMAFVPVPPSRRSLPRSYEMKKNPGECKPAHAAGVKAACAATLSGARRRDVPASAGPAAAICGTRHPHGTDAIATTE